MYICIFILSVGAENACAANLRYQTFRVKIFHVFPAREMCGNKGRKHNGKLSKQQEEKKNHPNLEQWESVALWLLSIIFACEIFTEKKESCLKYRNNLNKRKTNRNIRFHLLLKKK